MQNGRTPYLDDTKDGLITALNLGFYEISGRVPVLLVQMIEGCFLLDKSSRWSLPDLIKKTEVLLQEEEPSVIKRTIVLSNRFRTDI